MKLSSKIPQFVSSLIAVFALGAGNAFAQTPGAPTIGTASVGDASVYVSFTPPASAGGSAITSYTATCSPGIGLGTTTASGATAPIAVAGLVNGTAYGCFVTANNSAGSSAPSASVQVTPVAAAALTLIGVK